jgi:hypothetical protein
MFLVMKIQMMSVKIMLMLVVMFTLFPAQLTQVFAASTDIFANDGSYWTAMAPSNYFTKVTGGACYHLYNGTTWCKPLYYQWGLTKAIGSANALGIWSPSPVRNATASVSAFIPATNAVAVAKYEVRTQNGPISTCNINQNNYSNSFTVCGSYLKVDRVVLQNGSTSPANSQLAWDEIKIYCSSCTQ